MAVALRIRLLLWWGFFIFLAAGTLVTAWRSPIVSLIGSDIQIYMNGRFIVLHPFGVALLFAAEAAFSFLAASIWILLYEQVLAKPGRP